MSGIPDIPRLYTALAEWMSCLIYVLMLKHRFKGFGLAAILGGFLALQCLFLQFTGLDYIRLPSEGVTNLLWILCMAAAVGLMFLLIWICCETSLLDAAYCCVRAFVLAELAASLEWQIRCFFWIGQEAPPIPAMALLLGVYGVCFFIVWLLERNHMPRDGHMGINGKELCSGAVIGLAVFSVSNMGFLPLRTPFGDGSYSGLLVTRTVIDLGGYAILYAHHIQCSELRTRQELESMEKVLQNQYLQYQQSRESVDLINRKYHDLKHQIAVLRAETNAGRREAYLDEMEQEIKTYEAQNKTGNPVLDTILTTKSLYCIRNGITLTCVADGSLLEFMDVMDLSAIFGNALDNAIESVEQVADPEKRLIHLTVSARKGFVLVTVENYFEGSLSFEENLPVSTKNDKAFHGYGLKSVRYVARKYGGTITITPENNWFELKLLIPRPEET